MKLRTQVVFALFTPVIGLCVAAVLILAAGEMGRNWLPHTAAWVCGGFALLSVVGAVVVLREVNRNYRAISTSLGDALIAQQAPEVPGNAMILEPDALAKAAQDLRGALVEARARSEAAGFNERAFELSSAAMFLADTEFRITKLNRAAMMLMEERAEDFRSTRPDFDPKSLVGKGMDAFHQTPQKARARLTNPENLPAEINIAVGEAYLRLTVDAVSDEKGKLLGYVLEWRDQTDQMVNETLLEAIDRRQVRVLTSLDGAIKDLNEVAVAFLGAHKEQLIGQDATALFAALDREQDIWDRLRSGESLVQQFSVDGVQGQRILDGSATPVYDHRGNTTGYLLIGIDTTESHADLQRAEEDRARNEREQSQVVAALSESLNRMADGDLTATIDPPFAPQYEELRLNFNRAISNLLDAVSSVVEHASEINLEVGAISTSVGDLSQRTERQAATLETTAAAVEELTLSVQSAATGAQNAADIATAARENAEASSEVVRDAVSAMTQIERSSQDISKIIGVIDEISFQTNLLALNAGVEAARAGEKGLGFAVVASEVRGLAHRSLEAANEIKELIETSNSSVQHGVKLVGNTGHVLEQIVGSVSEISDLVNNIAASAREQSAGIGEINTAMIDLETTTQHNAAMSEETTAATLSLTGQAEALADVTTKFNTTRARSARMPLDPVSQDSHEQSSVADGVKAAVGLNRMIDGSVALVEDPALSDWQEF